MTSNSKEVQKKADAKRAGKRARAWTAIVYPESAPENWLELLSEQLVECLVSPLHDKDIEPTGEAKKAHYHVVLAFKNATTYENAKTIFDAIGAVVPPEKQCKVNDFKQMARYLCHLDQPNKHRYKLEDVTVFGAIDYAALVTSGSEEDDLLDEIFEFIRTYHIVSFAEFIDLVRAEKPEWRRVVYHQYNGLICRYIKAQAWEESRNF